MTHPSASRVFRTRFTWPVLAKVVCWTESAPKLIRRKVLAKTCSHCEMGNDQQWNYCNWKWEIKCNYLKIQHQRDIRRCSECPSFHITSATKASLISLISESAVAVGSVAKAFNNSRRFHGGDHFGNMHLGQYRKCCLILVSSRNKSPFVACQLCKFHSSFQANVGMSIAGTHLVWTCHLLKVKHELWQKLHETTTSCSLQKGHEAGYYSLSHGVIGIRKSSVDTFLKRKTT